MDHNATPGPHHPHHFVEHGLRIIRDSYRALVDSDIEAAILERQRLRVADLEARSVGHSGPSRKARRALDHIGIEVDAGHRYAELLRVIDSLGATAARDIEQAQTGLQLGHLRRAPGEREPARVQCLDAADLDRVLDRRSIEPFAFHTTAPSDLRQKPYHPRVYAVRIPIWTRVRKSAGSPSSLVSERGGTNMPSEAFIYDAVRTPRGIGKARGSLYEVRPVELLTTLLASLEERNELDTSRVDDVLIGCVTPVGDQGANIARTATLYAGWDLDVPGVQLNRFCASGLEAVNLAAQKVRSGWEDLVVAGGVESMSRLPMGSDGGAIYTDPDVNAAIGFVPQGISADLIATIEGFGREQVDELGVLSQERATAATTNGHFVSLISVQDVNGLPILAHDEAIRSGTTLEVLGGLAPSFAGMGELGLDVVARLQYPQVERIDHVHTPGNSSGIVDGAALVLVGSQQAGDTLGLQPRARVVAAAVVGTEPTIMLTGPAPACAKALGKAGMTLADIDLIEVNEAFAAVVLKFMRDMGIDDFDRINVNGGAIAMGHPLGATGAMLVGTVLDELERRDLTTGLITLCIGGGMGIATVIERV